MNENEIPPEDIKVCIAPTWEQNTKMLCVILREGTPEGQESAERRLIQMGALLDQLGVQRPW